jgi:hypothetical protein
MIKSLRLTDCVFDAPLCGSIISFSGSIDQARKLKKHKDNE